MKERNLLLIKFLILSILLFQSCASNNWHEIINHHIKANEYHLNKKYKITDKNSLIRYLLLTDHNIENNKEFLISRSLLKNIKSYGFDPVIYSIYLTKRLYYYSKYSLISPNEELLEVLQEFYKKDNNNSVPSYLLSYYYALQSDNRNYLKYLKEGNNKNHINFNSEEINKLLVDYYLLSTKDEIFSYSMVLDDHSSNLLIILGSLANLKYNEYNISSTFKNLNKNHYPSHEIYKLGKNIENSSNYFVQLLVAYAIQKEGINTTDKNSKQMFNEIDLKKKKLERIIFL